MNKKILKLAELVERRGRNLINLRLVPTRTEAVRAAIVAESCLHAGNKNEQNQPNSTFYENSFF